MKRNKALSFCTAKQSQSITNNEIYNSKVKNVVRKAKSRCGSTKLLVYILKHKIYRNINFFYYNLRRKQIITLFLKKLFNSVLFRDI